MTDGKRLDSCAKAVESPRSGHNRFAMGFKYFGSVIEAYAKEDK